MAELTMALVLEYYGADLSRVAEYGWRPVRCPFHDDRVASASVNLESGGFMCHACGMNGDVLSLIARREGLGTAAMPDRAAASEYAETAIGASVAHLRRSAGKRKARKRLLWRHSLFD